jgi:hypothetical protein
MEDTLSDGHWIDALGRNLVTGSSRRNILGLATALTASLIAGGTSDDTAAADPCNTAFKKKEDREFCRTKRNRCQRAGTTFCIHRPDNKHPKKHATCCPDGQECCDGRCTDPTFDNDNCGTCGNVCRSDELCIGGNCVPSAPPTCPAGHSHCPGVGCVNMSNDRRHCGTCGNNCVADHEDCIDGRCVCRSNRYYVYNAECGYCLPTNYICCGPSPAGHCWDTHVCVPNPDGVTFRCAGRGAQG